MRCLAILALVSLGPERNIMLGTLSTSMLFGRFVIEHLKFNGLHLPWPAVERIFALRTTRLICRNLEQAQMSPGYLSPPPAR